MVGSLVSARYGRRMCMFSMSCYALVTATIAITSTTREQILAARVLNCKSPLPVRSFDPNLEQIFTSAWSLLLFQSFNPRSSLRQFVV